MTVRSIHLRWRGRCCVCRMPLAAGELASFDDVAREIRCFRCAVASRVLMDRVPFGGAPSSAAARRRAEAEQVRIKALIADARAALDRARQAS